MEAAIDHLAFRRACARFATGITVATALDRDGAPHGMTVNSFASVSLDPPLLLICVDHSSVMLDLFRDSGRYGISVLSHSQRDLSQRFAERGQDRFNGTPWVPGQTGVPLLPDALAHFECEIRNIVNAGDHAILIAEVVALNAQEGTPVVFFDSGYRRLEGE